MHAAAICLPIATPGSPCQHHILTPAFMRHTGFRKANLRHQNVLALHEAFIHDRQFVCIVTELCEGGDLSNMIETTKFNGNVLPENAGVRAAERPQTLAPCSGINAPVPCAARKARMQELFNAAHNNDVR